MIEQPASAAEVPAGKARIVRHAMPDRLLHWLMAASVLVLLGTAFLPILGIEFGWVLIHWATGWALAALVIVHVLRGLVWQDWRAVWFTRTDFRDAWLTAARTMRVSEAGPGKPGKYTFAQKFIHFAFSVVVLGACVTGGLMMVKVDTPWWDRNPYWLSDGAWGLVYVVHDLCALLLVTMVMVHAYFALRPENRAYLRSMVYGWITRAEYSQEHDAERWRVES